jgi:hypothetical protein
MAMAIWLLFIQLSGGRHIAISFLVTFLFLLDFTSNKNQQQVHYLAAEWYKSRN